MTEQSSGKPPPKLDFWIVGQLRGQVLEDLKEHIPSDYFGSKTLTSYAPGDPSVRRANYEIQWGHNAGDLGRKLTFETPTGLTARQIAASEMLMHLGLLAAAQAAFEISQHVKQVAARAGTSVKNPNLVQLPETIAVFEKNLTQGLRQYLNYLSPSEQLPFLPLLHSSPDDARLTPNGFLQMTTQNFYGPVGAVMNGPDAVANVQQQWSDTSRTLLIDSLQKLTTAIQSTPETELSQELKDRLVEQIAAKSGEVRETQPDKSSFMSWLDGMATAVKAVEALKPVFDVVKEAVLSVLS